MRHMLTFLAIFTGLFYTSAKTVKGTVCSAEDESIIIGAEVTALIDSLQTLEAKTDNSGRFNIRILDYPVSCALTVSHPGYEDQTINIKNVADNVDLGKILLSARVSTLEEVSVSASSKRVIDLPDKSIIFPTQLEKNRATDPMNLLDQLAFSAPELSVSGNGRSVTILNSTPEILINGVKRNYADLFALDPQDIFKVEYITYPDIRYGAPYINIVTVKHPTGGSFMANLNAPVTKPQESHFLYASYRRGIHEVAVNYSGSYSKKRKEHSELSEQYFAPDRTYETELKGVSEHGTDRSQNITADYYLMGGPKKMLVTTAALSYGSGDRRSEMLSTGLNEKFTRYNNGDNRSLSPSLNIYGTLPVRTAGKIEVNISGSYSSGKYGSAMTETNGYATSTRVSNDAYSLNGNVYYEHNLSWSKLAATFSHRFSRASNVYTINGADQRNRLTQHRTVASATLSGQLRNIMYYYVAAGLYHTKVDKGYTTPYAAIFLRKPIRSLMLIYEFRTTTSPLGLNSYSDVIRPVNELLYATGNLNLKNQVSIFNRIYAGYGYRRFFTNLNVTYTNNTNPLFRVCEYIDNPLNPLYGKFLSTTLNGRNSSVFAADFTMSFNNLLDHYSIKLEASYKDLRSHGLGRTWRKSFLAGNINAAAYFGPWQFNVFANPFPSYSLSGNLLWMEMPYTVWGIGASWHKKAWSVGCQMNDFFIRKPFYQKKTTMAGDMTTRSRYWMGDNSNWISINVRYQISFGRQARKAQRTLNSDTKVDTGVSL